MHQSFEKRLVAVHEFQLAESRQDQSLLHLLDLAKGRDIPARDIIAQDGDAVIGAAAAVVEVLLPAEVGAPVGEKINILPLDPLPDRLALRLRIVLRDPCANFFFAGTGVQHMAAPLKLQLVVLHRPTPFR